MHIYIYYLQVTIIVCPCACITTYTHVYIYMYIYIYINIIVIIIVVVIIVIIIIITFLVLLLLFLSLLLCFICGYTMSHMHLESVGWWCWCHLICLQLMNHFWRILGLWGIPGYVTTPGPMATSSSGSVEIKRCTSASRASNETSAALRPDSSGEIMLNTPISLYFKLGNGCKMM